MAVLAAGAGLVAAAWLAVCLLVGGTVRAGRRAARARPVDGEGGVAQLLATELTDNLYLTDKMLADHTQFREMYDRIPPDYPDAFTINQAKVFEDDK